MQIITDYSTGAPRFKIIGGGDSGDAVAVPMTTAERTAITPDAGVMIWDTDLEKLFIGDGNTAGGIEVQGSGGETYDFNTNEFNVTDENYVSLKTIPLNKVEDGDVIFSTSAAQLSANTLLTAVENCDNRKNDYITLFGKFTGTFSPVSVMHGGGQQKDGCYIQIYQSHVQVYGYQNTLLASYYHGLTIEDFIYVQIKKTTNSSLTSDLVIVTKNGTFTKRNTPIFGAQGQVACSATMDMTDVVITYTVSDAENDIWAFGDSYMCKDAAWARQFVDAGHTGVMFSAFNGANSNDEILSFRTLISKRTPRIVVWCVGMNDIENNGMNANWKNAVDEVIETCQQKNITLILATIPNTPIRDNTAKNTYVKSSGLRYVDFAAAVNATTAFSDWYSGLLGEDQLHPTALGSTVLMNQFIMDCPESVLEGASYQTGYRLVQDGNVFSFNPYATIVNVSGSSVTFQPDTAYKIMATTGEVYVTANPPSSNEWAYEGHAEIFVGSVGYVVFDVEKITLANALEPDSVNNCTLRFHDGRCIVSVEDHIAGYIVSVNAASGSGSLYYGLATATNEYISIDASLNGQTLNLAGVTTSAGEKHVVGNGYAETIISGGITCTSNTTFSNLSMDGVVVSSGTLTFGDIYIPNGATVAVSGGGLAIERVTGSGGVIDLGNTKIVVSNYADIDGLSLINGAIGTTYGCYVLNAGILYLSDVNIDSGNATFGGVVHNTGTATLSNGTFDNNSATRGGVMNNNGTAYLSECIASSNTATSGGVMFNTETITILRGAYTNNTASSGGVMYNEAGTAYLSECIASSNTATNIGGMIMNNSGTAYLTECIASSNSAKYGGAVYNNTGTITILRGAYTNNTAEIGGMIMNNSGTAYLSECIASSNTATSGAAVIQNVNASCTIVSCTFSNNTDNGGLGIINQGGASAIMNISSSFVSGNTPNDARVNGGTLNIDGSTVGVIAISGGVVNIRNNNTITSLSGTGGGSVVIFSGASISLTSSINPGGTGKITVSGGAVTVNGNSIPTGTYTSINSNGTPT